MDQPLLSLRAAVVLLIAALAGVLVGVLTAHGGEPLPRSVLAGLLAAGGTLAVTHRLVAGPGPVGTQQEGTDRG
ncbi:hypothetical protein ACN20G_36990 (plasmid) [Streptomyces sp. BI20]|uniref:hypothetical protein n=1 Tax=Streptomyces sp. BI20 TaxID=3403460 RepID=UPI003C73392D